MTVTEETLRTEVRKWLADAWDPALTVGAWWFRLAESGYGFPHWPSEWFGRPQVDRDVPFRELVTGTQHRNPRHA